MTKYPYFEYFLSKVVDINPGESGSDINLKLLEHSFSGLKSILYFSCLINKDLFHTFDNFKAYLNGPVEVDIYENRNSNDLFQTFIFDGKRFKVIGENFIETFEDLDVGIKLLIDNSISFLKSKSSVFCPDRNILYHSTVALVDFFRSLIDKVWKECFYYNKFKGSISKLFESDPSLIDLEGSSFISKLI